MSHQKQSLGGTPWAVICEEHGRVYLTEEEYERQMNNPNQTWRCPCGGGAQWDDDNYEKYLDSLEAEPSAGKEADAQEHH